MLTIDRIVAEYEWRGSEAYRKANLRRSGWSAAGIEKALAMHREYAPTAAERKRQIEEFRTELIALPRAEQISRYLLLFGSHERAIPLWEETDDEPADVFWPVFLENWCVCDGLWPMRKLLLPTLRRRFAQLSPIPFMKPGDRQFYEALPDRVTVFRGCGRRRVRGLPWTTDLTVAEKFARGGRFPPPPDPVIARAEIDKADIFFVSGGRKESELILDPYRITRLWLEPIGALQMSETLGH
jgi:hypothetical protein